eukprot:5408-Heterococcus_DN1.PRE.1
MYDKGTLVWLKHGHEWEVGVVRKTRKATGDVIVLTLTNATDVQPKISEKDKKEDFIKLFPTGREWCTEGLQRSVLKIELHRELVAAMDRLLLKHWKLPEGAPLTEPVVKRLICATRFSMMNCYCLMAFEAAAARAVNAV